VLDLAKNIWHLISPVGTERHSATELVVGDAIIPTEVIWSTTGRKESQGVAELAQMWSVDPRFPEK
jgi:hypothetical protein